MCNRGEAGCSRKSRELRKNKEHMQNIIVWNIFLETSMVPIWPGAFFTFFSLPMLGPKMASLKLSKMLETQRFLACFCQRCTQTCEAGCDSKGRIMPKSIEKHWQYVYFWNLLRDLSGAKVDRCPLGSAAFFMFKAHIVFRRQAK